ncbi:glycosyltransferase family 2 protein [Photobacterium sanctipauli]|uniref:Glycosyltransferase family 2 protein n=1 Tax=Photobacterium sanctipauli TaxID=1342794 RepID=A0A2T3NSM5_9GAMM|nr:glycosyltransferase family 2 protein [Photobacterium sanctipauli]PSW19286.1 glycosyltransferase family 2 protein [Photobacterium sanctipauli]
MITGNIITLNESKNIVDCIKSLQQVCDEIFVIDSLSTDNTVELAQEMGAIVIEQEYLGDGIQKNVVLKHAKNDWVLTIDADERLTPEAAEEIKQLNLDSTQHDAFSMKRRNYIGNRWIKHCGWYPDRCTRLYNTKKTTFKNVKQHASVDAHNTKALQNDIIHYSFENLGQLFAKPDRNFSTRSAKIMYQKGRKANAFSPFLHGLSAFIRKYVLQTGFLGGVDGMTVALSSAVNSYLKYAKLLEYQRDPSVLEKEDFNKIW